MALEFANSVWFTAGSSGTATFSDGTAKDGYRNLSTSGLTNTNTVHYRAQNPDDETEWENGLGTYASAGPTLARTTVFQSSNSDATVNFSNAPEIVISPLNEFISTLLPTANPTFVRPSVKTIREAVYTISGTTPAIDSVNGGIQLWTLSGNSTPTFSFTNGDGILLRILDGTAYTVTWTNVDEWVGDGAPTLDTTNENWIVIWQNTSRVYAASIGDSS